MTANRWPDEQPLRGTLTSHQAAVRLAHILGIGVVPAETLILLAERDSAGQHVWHEGI